MAFPIPMREPLDAKSARAAWERWRALDSQPADSDSRPDFVEWSEPESKFQVQLEKNGFLARQSQQAGDVSVVRCRFPSWFALGQRFETEVVCRSAHGAYSGYLNGQFLSESSPEDQEAARQVFYAWQKPLQKPGNDG